MTTRTGRSRTSRSSRIEVRFPAPVKAGSRIRLAITARLTEVEEVPAGLQITVDGTIEIEGEVKPAAVLQSLSRFYA